MGVEQAEDIVVGPHQEGDRVRVWLVVGQDGRVHVTMRRNERETGHQPVEFYRQFAYRRLRREQPVGVRERLGRGICHHGKLPQDRACHCGGQNFIHCICNVPARNATYVRRTGTKATEERHFSALPAGAVPADLELAFVNTDLEPYRRASAKPSLAPPTLRSRRRPAGGMF